MEKEILTIEEAAKYLQWGKGLFISSQKLERFHVETSLTNIGLKGNLKEMGCWREVIKFYRG